MGSRSLRERELSNTGQGGTHLRKAKGSLEVPGLLGIHSETLYQNKIAPPPEKQKI